MKTKIYYIILISAIIVGVAWAAQLGPVTSGDTLQQGFAISDANDTELYAVSGVSDCTVGPCFDGTADSGTILYWMNPAGTFYTALQGGATLANRSWRLPIGAAPGAGLTNLLNVDEFGQFGQISSLTYQPQDTNLDTLATPTNWRIFYSNGSATLIELALGADGTVLTSTGASTAPAFEVVAGTGDVVGPGSSTDNAFPRYDSTTGKLIQGGQTTEDDSGNVIVAGTLTATGGVSAGASVLPTLSFDDSDSLDADQTVAQIFANATTVTGGAVVSDITFTYKNGGDASGAFTNWLILDGSDNQAEFQINTTLQNGDIELLEMAANSVDSTQYVDGSIDFEHLSAGAKFQSLAVADLNDPTTPSVLTTAETTNKVISNYKATGADHVFTMDAAHAAGNVIFPIGDEFQVDIEPDTGELFYLNGTAMAANEHIQNTADTLGQQIVGYCANINGSLVWMFESKYTDFVEETP